MSRIESFSLQLRSGRLPARSRRNISCGLGRPSEGWYSPVTLLYAEVKRRAYGYFKTSCSNSKAENTYTTTSLEDLAEYAYAPPSLNCSAPNMSPGPRTSISNAVSPSSFHNETVPC